MSRVAENGALVPVATASVIVFTVLACFAAWACQSGGPSRVCIPGITLECTGADGCSGAQSCLPDGSALGVCHCSSASAAPEDAGTAPVNSESAVGDAMPVPSARLALSNLVAAPCTKDEECGPDLRCWSATTRGLFSIQGGAAGGYCTRACRVDADCSSLDLAAGCLLNQAAVPICARRCLTHAPRAGEQKCLDRPDLGCYSLGVEPQAFNPLGREEGACSPVCRTDAECPGGFCDPLTRICIDARSAGAGVGAPCRTAGDCAGNICLATPTGSGVCSVNCVFGTRGCGYEEQAESPGAVCALPGDGSLGGVGDVALCLELCDVSSDCSHPDAVCRLDAPAAGRAGYCDFPLAATPDAGAAP